jgi:hypothetical protein
MTDTEIRRRLASGDWRLVMGDVIVVAAAPVAEEMMAWTAVLTVGPPVAIVGRFAGAWHRLDSVPAYARPEVVIPRR